MGKGYRGAVTTTLDTEPVDPRVRDLELRVRRLEHAEWKRHLNRWTIVYAVTMFLLFTAFFFALVAIERAP